MKTPDYVKDKIWLKSYPDEVRREMPLPSRPLFSLTEEQAERHPDRIALVFEGEAFSFRDLHEKIIACAASLCDMGVKKGDKVAIFLPNCPQFAMIYFAALRIGAVVTAIGPLSVPREVAFQLHDSETETIFALDQFIPKVDAVHDQVELKRKVAVSFVPGSPNFGNGWTSFGELLKGGRSAPAADVDLEKDLAVLQYTGGTTGVPKGVMLTHLNVLANVLQTSWFDDPVKKRYGLEYYTKAAILPWYHIYGQTVDMSSSLCNGHKLVVFPRFDPETFLSSIPAHGIQVIMGAPPIFIRLANHPLISKTDLSSLIWCNNGAGPLPLEVIRKFEEGSGGKTVYEGFGLSEASPVTNSTSPIMVQKKGSVGPPYPGTEEAVWDAAANDFAPLNEVGELLVCGPQVMAGYWKHPEETEQSFLEIEGRRWLRTGDMARMDEDGYVWIVDRAKDMIKYKGHSVYPREVEEVLHEHPDVVEAAVVGVPDPEVVENIKAFVVLTEKAKGKLSEEAFIDWAKERMSSYKHPRIVEFRDELPKSHAGKYLKRELRDKN